MPGQRGGREGRRGAGAAKDSEEGARRGGGGARSCDGSVAVREAREIRPSSVGSQWRLRGTPMTWMLISCF